jgi:MFS family permease
MAAGFLLTGVAALLSGKLRDRVGLVTSVVWARGLGLALLLALPLAPTFALAAAAYILRSALNRGSVGARQALTVGLVRDERRGLATSLNAVSMQLPQSLGPSAAGFLFGAGQLELPFFAGAVFQGAYLAAYAWFFRGHNKPQDEPTEAAA